MNKPKPMAGPAMVANTSITNDFATMTLPRNNAAATQPLFAPQRTQPKQTLGSTEAPPTKAQALN